MSHTATTFQKLHSSIQTAIWDLQWQSLRKIQIDTIEHVISGTGDVLIAASTASGKTEAAFLPVLSSIASEPGPGIRAIYIGPLKALINDQFRRLEELCKHADIAVHRWHGDVNASAKKRLINTPSGVLLITPESLESLFINRSSNLLSLFGDTRFVVIDEVHSFMGTERGIHLQSLLRRLDLLRGRPSRRIGLSATVGDLNVAGRWLASTPETPVSMVVGIDSRMLQIIIHGFLQKRPARFLKPPSTDAHVIPDNPEDDIDDNYDVAQSIYRAMKGHTNLVFANSKATLEEYTDMLNRICTKQRRPPEFLIHHGSLSKDIREYTELQMRAETPFTTLCSNTLEMGIDVGQIKCVGQLDPPSTVSALVQRLGRSGRSASEPSRLRFFIREEKPDELSTPVKRLHIDLLQAVAMVELLTQAPPWCETPSARLHYSTLIHQILSVLTQTGGIQAGQLYDRLIRYGAFTGIVPGDFKQLVHEMGRHDLIEQMPDGNLILGLKGERIVNHYTFYAAFHTPEQFVVLYNGTQIGHVEPMPPEFVGEHMILAGRRWQIQLVAEKQKEILVAPAHGAKPPIFTSSGMYEIAPEIRQKMFEVLTTEQDYRYLDSKAQSILTMAREAAHELQIKDNNILRWGEELLFFPWTGTRIMQTLLFTGQALGLNIEADRITLNFIDCDPDAIYACLQASAQDAFTPLQLAAQISRAQKYSEKFDEFLPDLLLDQSYVQNHLDIEGARQFSQQILASRFS